MVNAINGIAAVGAQAQAAKAAQSTAEGASFTDILSNAIAQARTAGQQSDANTLALLSGDVTDLHTAVITAEKAELTLNLAIQIRNKVIDAYNEVMRMSV